ncbi:division/cell wall cluster transcriptional repressor MraZ [Mycoplasma sp. 'Moose RK']|uniref:division/cell wall cluster transcriptional repressor MraZ n=1 Tax=Mycoplasma sp. 'Moose RK' TaxID=2780095 RepID=UPI0018C1E505|nr:division/cell wall cluster transcriptional repressor MraZ [Mycoplasma sp. 'Moose RK']MBG0730727.1 division/cell wall cluster transcriptional repressor MraZ [Mycoplasma sp. 'Moose RK']
MFGTIFRVLDEKNRIVMPPAFRNELDGDFYISANLEKILEIRSQAEFDLIAQKIGKANSLDPKLRDFARYFFGNTVKISVDKQGRFLIPKNLLDLAAIEKKLYLIGVNNKIEIWPEQKYDEFYAKFSDSEMTKDLEKELLESGVEL